MTTVLIIISFILGAAIGGWYSMITTTKIIATKVKNGELNLPEPK